MNISESSHVPRVAIIMPTYNCRRFIGEAVRSVIAQSFTDWTLLILDDGSTDGTEEELAPLLSDPRIVYEKQENMGQPRTRNKGVRNTLSPLIALLDADDIWHPEKLAIQVGIFDRYPDVGVCGTGMRYINPESKVIGDSFWADFHGRALPDLVTTDLQIGMSTSVTRREVFERIGYFDEGFLPFSMDYDFWLRAALEFDFHLTGENLVDYRVGHASISKKGGDRRRDLVLDVVIPRFLKEYGGDRYVKPRHIRTLRARMYKNRGDTSQGWWTAFTWFVRALALRPLDMEIWRGFVGRLFPFVKTLLAPFRSARRPTASSSASSDSSVSPTSPSTPSQKELSS